MILIDEIRDYGPKGQWCHCWSDTNDEEGLRWFITALGIRRNLHRSRGAIGDFPHYDLNPVERVSALALGARGISLKEHIIRTTSALEQAKKYRIYVGQKRKCTVDCQGVFTIEAIHVIYQHRESGDPVAKIDRDCKLYSLHSIPWWSEPCE